MESELRLKSLQTSLTALNPVITILTGLRYTLTLMSLYTHRCCGGIIENLMDYDAKLAQMSINHKQLY